MVTEEEVAALEERLTEAEAKVERLQTIAADREARAAHLEDLSAAQTETLAQTKAELASRDEALAALHEEIAAARSEADELRAGLRSAAEKYRQAVLASRAEVPPDLVSGETVEEVDRQLEAALRMVAQLKSHLESQAQAQRVPTGAPARRAPDLAALSPTEKISHGLTQKR
jgi:DNA repair exonuclease SbcCD ATPase subunit